MNVAVFNIVQWYIAIATNCIVFHYSKYKNTQIYAS